ncbi:MAG: protein-disulfide reductase DsbD domain-containing protein [bacterium]
MLVARLGKQLDSNVRAFQYDYLTGTFGISDTAAYRSQVLAVLVDIEMAAGFHLYGTPIPKGYRPLTVTFEENPNFAVDAVHFPQTRRFEMASLGETFNLLPKDIHLETALRIHNKPEFGQHVVKAAISFQACDDKGCRFPEEASFEFPLRIAQ